MRRLVVIAYIALFSSCLFAGEDTASHWTGEWGSFEEAKAAGEMRSQGQRISITSCLRETCQATISTLVLSGDHCDGAGDLHVDSPNQATLKLKPPFPDPKHECLLTLTLHEEGTIRTISAKPKTGNCNFFCTPKCSFERQFSFRSATPFVGDDIPGCYLARSKALSAVCSDKSLADTQKAWMGLADATNALYARPADSAKLRDQAQAKCSTAEDAAACLRAFFHDDGVRLSRLKSEWQAGVTKDGDPAKALRKAAAIVGTYTHSFKNATAQGDRYRSTDSLELASQPGGKLHFKVDVNFANGHSCSIEGASKYKANGAFVYQSSENGENCVLEIFAGDKAVEFQDPLGGCKSYCGARGSLAGAKFRYSERKK